jgi:hypothetical protein
MAEQIRQQQQEKAMLAMIPERMSAADQYMIDIPGMQPVEWKTFCGVVRLSDDREFAIVEQRRFEQCGAEVIREIGLFDRDDRNSVRMGD